MTNKSKEDRMTTENTTKMNPEIKTKWLEALRSGEYRQTRHRLRSTQGGFCCLGVLCDVLDPHAWSPRELIGQDHRGDFYEIPFDGQTSMPSMSVIMKAGLPWDTGKTLAKMNDNKRMTFKQIANFIEENL